MPAKDFFHEHVKRALVKDGWTITDDPLSLKWLGTVLFIDLGAERLIAAEKGAQKIAVEIKSFIGDSKVEDLKDAVGQFILYRSALRTSAPQRQLFLAIRDDVHINTFAQPEGELLRQEENIHLLIFNAQTEGIIEWIS